MKFDKAELKVKAGAGVELAFTNNDPMPMMHNLLVIEPGSRVDIVTKAATMGAAGMINNFVPESDKVLRRHAARADRQHLQTLLQGPNQAGQVRVRLHLPGARLLHVGHSNS